MFAVGTPNATSALNLLNLATIIEPNGPIYNGPGAEKPKIPFALRPLEFHEREAVDKAKKYAMEQSIRAVLLRQTQSQQSQQLNNIKKNQTVALLNRVYVGSIAYDVKEDSLRQVFSSFGPLKTISMSWDPATQKHKGFAFLEFEYPEAAHLAIEQMNNTSFGGRQLKVGRPSNLANADPIIADLVAEYKLQNRVYVSGIHLDLTEDDVALVFEAFGKIVFCRLLVDPNSVDRHRGFGYIEYENTQSAIDAVASMNQFNLGGQLLRVCRAISPPDGISNASASALPPAAAVAAASVTAKVLSMETEQLPINATQSPSQSHMFAAPAESALGIYSADPSLTLGVRCPTTRPQHTSGFQLQSELTGPSSLNNSSPHQPYLVEPQSTGSWHSPLPQTASACAIESPPHSAALPSENPTGVDQMSSFTDALAVPLPGILILRNMVGPEDCDDELEDEVLSECSQYGNVERVLLHQQLDTETNTIIVKVFVHFTAYDAMLKAVEALNGRFFARRQITAEPYDLHAFASNDFSH